ncbi:Toll/interleukin-1 receptor domain-containing protein, partial [Tanacetum coccineum]
ATQATKCIKLDDGRGLKFEMLMKGLANMQELRFLQLDCTYEIEDEVSNWNLPNALRFLRWEFYPFSSLPKTFQPKNLVGLEMEFSDIVHIWKDGEEKPFPNLRFLKLRYLRYLRTLDLSVAPNLETLILKSCPYLVELDFQVTPNLKELQVEDPSPRDYSES